MYRRRVVLVLGLLCAFVAQAAHAYFDPLWITPNAPRAGEVVSVNIRGGGCDAIFYRPGYPQFIRTGNAIRIVEYGIHDAPSGFCIYPLGTLVETVGVLPPGDYTLIVDLAYDGYPFGETTITLGVIMFTVTGASAPAAVPSLTMSGKLALILLALGSGLWASGMRTRTGVARA